MKKVLFGLLLLCSGTAFGQVSVGISIGAPPPPRVEIIAVRPSVDYNWVGGYWYPDGGRYIWHGGYWSRPPYAGAQWIAPRHDGHYYHEGYWGGNRGNVPHDHNWDKGHDRDYNHGGNGNHGGGEHHEGHR